MLTAKNINQFRNETTRSVPKIGCCLIRSSSEEMDFDPESGIGWQPFTHSMREMRCVQWRRSGLVLAQLRPWLRKVVKKSIARNSFDARRLRFGAEEAEEFRI